VAFVYSIMTSLFFSFIVPVFNRPQEIRELLHSLVKLHFEDAFEVVIVEDGSKESSESVVREFDQTLNISYFFKDNSGPGDSRNFGMRNAKGNYFIVLDSDCILPSDYLRQVKKELTTAYVDCFGGPDAAHESFTRLQKAINYSMTSFLTTGGIRGNKKAINKFQPRSFNMGISKKVFEVTQGFGNIHPGEDPDLTFRIWKAGFDTRLFPQAFVYHKRRIDWKKFFTQVNKFGKVRPILNQWHPDTKKLSYWFPAIFIFGFFFALVCAVFGFAWILFLYGIYFSILFVDALIKNKDVLIAFYALIATGIQFFGYGIGFLTSSVELSMSTHKPEKLFPKLFFKNKSPI